MQIDAKQAWNSKVTNFGGMPYQFNIQPKAAFNKRNILTYGKTTKQREMRLLLQLIEGNSLKSTRTAKDL